MATWLGRGATATLLGLVLAAAGSWAAAEEPPALNPFGPVQQDRDDALPGYVEMSDGKVLAGNVYLTRDRRIKVYDEQMKRQREIPLAKVKQVETKVKREWMEKEWRFKELALDEKVFTGRSYPVREYIHTITLTDGRTITGTIDETVVFVQPFTYSPREGGTGYKPQAEASKFILYQENKGEMGAELKSIKYIKVIKLGKEALEEGQKKASTRRPTQPATKPSE